MPALPDNPEKFVTIRVPAGRRAEGELYVATSAGIDFHGRCLARSDQSAANAAGNPTRDPLHHYGDLPCGVYRASLVQPPRPDDAAAIRSYGAGPRWLLTPVSGDGLRANRSGLELHGGPTGSPMPPNALRPTHGCCRVDDSTIARLAEYFPAGEEFEVRVEEYPA